MRRRHARLQQGLRRRPQVRAGRSSIGQEESRRRLGSARLQRIVTGLGNTHVVAG